MFISLSYFHKFCKDELPEERESVKKSVQSCLFGYIGECVGFCVCVHGIRREA